MSGKGLGVVADMLACKGMACVGMRTQVENGNVDTLCACVYGHADALHVHADMDEYKDKTKNEK